MSGTPRHLRDAQPKYALVVWPDAIDRQQPECIELAGVEAALRAGAVIVAREDSDFCNPRAPQPVEPALLKIIREHPYRWNANWRSDDEEWR